MTSNVKAIPEGYEGAIPYLSVKGASDAIEFYKKAFGATEIMRLADPASGKIGHAEIKIGNALIMLADEFPEMGFRGPEALGGSPVIIHMYVEDIDTFFNQALAAGATVQRPLKDEFYGDRTGSLKDPFGHAWSFATHKEDVSIEEMNKRHEALLEKRATSEQ